MKRAIRSAAIATALGTFVACADSPTAPATPANIAGTYNATITASSTCASVPSADRVLIYGAEVTQNGAAAQMQWMPHGGTPITLAATVSGQTVDLPGFTLNGSNGGVAVSVVATAGKASVAASGKITRTFSGTYQASSGPSCNAANHQLEMSRCSIVCSGNICSCQ